MSDLLLSGTILQPAQCRPGACVLPDLGAHFQEAHQGHADQNPTAALYVGLSCGDSLCRAHDMSIRQAGRPDTHMVSHACKADVSRMQGLLCRYPLPSSDYRANDERVRKGSPHGSILLKAAVVACWLTCCMKKWMVPCELQQPTNWQRIWEFSVRTVRMTATCIHHVNLRKGQQHPG